MTRDEIIKLLETELIRTGHFELSSGRHSATYIQCALVLQHPQHAEKLGSAIAAMFKDHHVSCVASPALGGLIIGHEVARGLGVRAIFVERDRSGQMALRRGFELKPGEKTLVIEDVWTTGGSTRETIGVVEQEGGSRRRRCRHHDRSGGRSGIKCPGQSAPGTQFAPGRAGRMLPNAAPGTPPAACRKFSSARSTKPARHHRRVCV